MDTQERKISDALSSLMQGRPIQKPENIPLSPKVAPVFADSKDEKNGISLLVGMTYHSISGNVKDRDILIRRIMKSNGEYYIVGVAMDIRAPRLIKVAHIQEIRDVISGRVYQNPYDFLAQKFGVVNTVAPVEQKKKNEFSTVVDRTGHEMTVLMYLIAIDSKRDKRERDVVFQFVKNKTQDLTYDDDELTDYLNSLAPDEECFLTSFKEILKQSYESIQQFVETMIDVIMSDGVIDPRERTFLGKVLALLDKQGFNIELPEL